MDPIRLERIHVYRKLRIHYPQDLEDPVFLLASQTHVQIFNWVGRLEKLLSSLYF